MKFGNFLFPDSRDPERDGIVIDETLREAWLSDELGVDMIWLAEHHFDGICAYADPIAFAGALADLDPAQPGSALRCCRWRCITRSAWPSNWRCSTTSPRGG